MGRGLLDEETLRLINASLPDVYGFSWVLHWTPDVVSMNFPPNSTVPAASTCFHDVQNTLAETRAALFECYAHAIYYRVVAAPPDEYMAVFYERYYANDVAYRLYAAAEHLAAAIEAMLEISPQALKPHRGRRTSRQAVLAAYLQAEKREHPVTDAVRRLGQSRDWQEAMTLRAALVHEQPPLLQGTGIVYERGPRWKATSGGGQRLSIGGGDKPTLSTETIVDFLHRATGEFLSTYSACLDVHTKILATHRLTMNDAGEVIVRL